MAPVVIGVTLAASAYSARQQYKAGKQAAAMGEANAQRQMAETQEAVRRLGLQQHKTLARTSAGMAVSGVGGRSAADYFNEMRKTFKEEREWMLKAGASAADISRREGQLAKTQAYGGVASTIAGAAGSVYGAGKGSWWS